MPSTPTNANTNGESGSSVDHVPGTPGNAGGGAPAPAGASKVRHVSLESLMCRVHGVLVTENVPCASHLCAGAVQSMGSALPVSSSSCHYAAGCVHAESSATAQCACCIPQLWSSCTCWCLVSMCATNSTLQLNQPTPRPCILANTPQWCLILNIYPLAVLPTGPCARHCYQRRRQQGLRKIS